MRLSIAIVNWNTSDLLEKCLESIRANDFEFEVVVVDNASDDFDLDSLLARFPEVKFIRNAENKGYAQGNNQAIGASVGDYILLLNPDVELRPGALQALVSFMESHPEAGAAGCRLERPDGRVEQSCRGFPTPMAIAAEYLGLSSLFPKWLGAYRMVGFQYDQEREVDQPMGSCLIMSRRAVDDVGAFDPQFPIFFNEVDWLMRAKNKGWKVYFTPSAEAIHLGGASTRQVRDKMRVESHRSLLRFYRKHYGRGIGYMLVAAAVYINMYVIHKPGKELRN
jgi:GT2 family glycosyltransferase